MNTIFIKSLNKYFNVDVEIDKKISVYFADNTISQEPVFEQTIVKATNTVYEKLKVIFENNEYCINFM